MRRLLLVTTVCVAMLNSGKGQAAPGAHGPNGEHLTAGGPVQGQVTGRQADGSVQMPMAQQRALGIITQLAQPGSSAAYVLLDGIVRHHPDGRAVVQPSSDGRLDSGPNGLPVSGQRVKAGDVLAYVRYQDTAYELASQNSELIALQSSAEQVSRDIKRLEALGNLAAQQQLEQLQTELNRLTQQQKQLQQGLKSPEVLLSRMSGIVHSDNLSRGQRVKAGDTLFEIIDPSRLMVEALTSDGAVLSQLDSASARQAPGISLQFVGHAARLKQGQIPLYFVPQAATSGAVPLLLNQPVTLHAKLKQQVEGIVLPAQAVVPNSANLPVVWIKLSAERFLPQLVQYSQLDPEHVLIRHGLGADNRVVVQGASLLNQVR